MLLAGLSLLQARRFAGERWIPWPLVGSLIGLLLLLAVTLPAPLGSPATAADYNAFAARFEWHVLPLHGLLTLAQRIRPGLGFVGTMVIPGLAVLWLLALPWLDRKPIHLPPSPHVRGVGVAGVGAVLVLALMNVGSIEPILGAPGRPPASAVAREPAGVHVAVDPAMAKKGRTLFEQNGCSACNKLGGQGGAVGPPLDGEGSRRPDLNWHIKHLKNPSAVSPGSTMPSFKRLSESDLRALATYLLSLK